MITGMDPELPPGQSRPDASDDAPRTPPAAAAPDEAPGDRPETPPAAAHNPAAETFTDSPASEAAGEEVGGGDQMSPPPPPRPSGGDSGPAGDDGAGAPFRILRSRQDRKLGGVAGGLAATAELDPTLVRLAIVLGFLTGWGILAYLVAWAVIPEEDAAKGRYLVPAPERTAKHIRIGLTVVAMLGILHVVGTILGIVSSALIGLGLFPARVFGFGRDSGFEAGEALFGLFLLIGGCLLLFRRHLPWTPATDTGTGSGARLSGSPGPPPSGSSSSGTGMARASMVPGRGGPATAGGYGPPPSPPGSAGGAPGSAGTAGFSARASAAARAARTNGPLLLVRAAGWLIGLWFLAAAVLGGVFWVTGALRVRFPVLPIVAVLAALGVLGYTLLRSRRVAAVVAAMALLLVPTALAAGVTRVDGQAGDRSITPMVPSDLDQEYRHAIGVLSLDLSNLQLPPGLTPLKVSMGAGQVKITVPWDAEVEARASVGAGSFDLFGNRQTGVNLDGRSRSTGESGAPVLVIAGRAGAGEIIVRRGYEPFTHQALRTGQPVPLSCHPSGAPDPAGAVSETMNCSAADGVTKIPALACVVSDTGSALCRPVGEPEPAVDFADDPGTRRCQVPAGGGESTCTAPIPGTRSRAGQGAFTCTIPEGGGPAVCHPAGSGTAPPPAAPAAPAPPDDPGSANPTTTVTSVPPAAPGEYRCTVSEDGGPAICEPG
jgi:phage shock protein PspC (stress-responsive transcriptional regulator)